MRLSSLVLCFVPPTVKAGSRMACMSSSGPRWEPGGKRGRRNATGEPPPVQRASLFFVGKHVAAMYRDGETSHTNNVIFIPPLLYLSTSPLSVWLTLSSGRGGSRSRSHSRSRGRSSSRSSSRSSKSSRSRSRSSRSRSRSRSRSYSRSRSAHLWHRHLISTYCTKVLGTKSQVRMLLKLITWIVF